MLGKPFINEGISMAIENYLKFKDKPDEPIYSSFPVQVIRTLVFIYGELDIINPYITHNEHNMGGFDSNIMKYGFPKSKLDDFKQSFLSFYQEKRENKTPNLSFLKIEKYLIDMYFAKEQTMNLLKENQETFKTYLYFPEQTNPIMQNDLNQFVLNKEEIPEYFRSVAFEKAHQFSLEELKRSTLIPEAYLLTGYSLEQIASLNDNDLRLVNQKVYEFFRVNPTMNDRDDYLLKAVNYYKKYGNRITSGNGYVDFLLFASILVTGLFVAMLIVFHI